MNKFIITIAGYESDYHLRIVWKLASQNKLLCVYNMSKPLQKKNKEEESEDGGRIEATAAPAPSPHQSKPSHFQQICKKKVCLYLPGIEYKIPISSAHTLVRALSKSIRRPFYR